MTGPGLDPRQPLDLVVRPVLAYLALPGGQVAERLVTWNSRLGAGHPEQFVAAYRELVAPLFEKLSIATSGKEER